MKLSLLYIDYTPTPWCAHGGYGKNSYDKKAKEKAEYRRQIKEQWGNKPIITGPVNLKFFYAMPIAKSTSKIRREQMLDGRIYHMQTPDTTNLNKLAEDTLKGIVLIDDKIAQTVQGTKYWATKPCIQIWVEEINKDGQQ